MKYIEVYVENNERNIAVIPDKIDEFGWGDGDGGYSPFYYYCDKCGTFYYELDTWRGKVKEYYDDFEKLAAGKKVIKTELRENDYGRLNDTDYLKEDMIEGILISKHSYHEGKKNSRHYKITDHYYLRDWFYQSRNSLDRGEILKPGEKKCRYCGTPLPREHNSNNSFYGKYSEAKDTFEDMAEYKRVAKETEQFISESYDRHTSEIRTSTAVVDLLTYVKHIINLEANIEQLAYQLNHLIIMHRIIARKQFKLECAGGIIERESYLKLKKKKSKLKKPKPLPDKILPSDVGLTEPLPPNYRKAGLFNKKKVEEENRVLEKQYLMELAEFNILFDKAKVEARIRMENRLKEYDNKIFKIDNEILEIEEKIRNEKWKDLSKPYEDLSAHLYNEIEEAKEKIIELCAAKKDLLSIGLIHPKYQDIFAITTIEEYLETGRCTQLTGPDGAYNLYEQELRANLIINKIDTVIKNLEMIRANQYCTYCVLTKINNNCERISKTLNNVANTAEIIAYNTEKIAQYARIQNDLTNSLGFLLALK